MATGENERMDMTPETKAYLDQQFEHLEKRILDITDPIKKTLDDYRQNFVDVFLRIGKVETDVAILKDNKGSRQNSAPIIISVVFGVVMAVVAVLALLL